MSEIVTVSTVLSAQVATTTAATGLSGHVLEDLAGGRRDPVAQPRRSASERDRADVGDLHRLDDPVGSLGRLLVVQADDLGDRRDALEDEPEIRAVTGPQEFGRFPLRFSVLVVM